MFSRKVVLGSLPRLTIVDHNETYGRHILEKIAKTNKFHKCVDIGCGGGTDLMTIKKYNPNAELIGIDYGSWNSDKLSQQNIIPLSVNIERENMPFEDGSVDIFIANQILEHTKEIFWINHEIFICLKNGGYLFIGVPNILSFHNRLLMLFGFHPTQHRLVSSHVRPFSKVDVFDFYGGIGNSFCKIEGFWGSQFYPFPKMPARILSTLFPSLAFSIFFLIRKTDNYIDDFSTWPDKQLHETNFYKGANQKNKK